jgi:hypothetical protein
MMREGTEMTEADMIVLGVLMVVWCVYPAGKKVFQFFQTEKKFYGKNALSPKNTQNPAN